MKQCFFGELRKSVKQAKLIVISLRRKLLLWNIFTHFSKTNPASNTLREVIYKLSKFDVNLWPLVFCDLQKAPKLFKYYWPVSNWCRYNEDVAAEDEEEIAVEDEDAALLEDAIELEPGMDDILDIEDFDDSLIDEVPEDNTSK